MPKKKKNKKISVIRVNLTLEERAQIQKVAEGFSHVGRSRVNIEDVHSALLLAATQGDENFNRSVRKILMGKEEG